MANKTKIGWCDYTINPVKGLCPVACDYCYARRMYKRFKWNPEIREILPGFLFEELRVIKKPSRIFWGSTFELFHDSIPDLWRKDIFAMVGQFPQHTHIFLTKRPENLIKFSPFPDNCWVGVTATDDVMFAKAYSPLKNIRAKVKFISFEPLIKWDMSVADVEWTLRDAGISWVIIGQQTPVKRATTPQVEWVEQLVYECVVAGKPVFLKENLIDCLPPTVPFYVPPAETLEKGEIQMVYRQEIPDW